MYVTIGQSTLFREYRRLEGKDLLLDLMEVTPCAPSNLDKDTARPGIGLIEAVKRKQNKCWGTFPATYFLLSYALSMCGNLGADAEL